jgi:hypothetical protein
MRTLLIVLMIVIPALTSDVEYVDQLQQVQSISPDDIYIPSDSQTSDSLTESIPESVGKKLKKKLKKLKKKLEYVSNDVSGYVVKDSVGIPGLSVYLVHPLHGRSKARVSDEDGYFEFEGIPYGSLSDTDLFYIEVYWGEDLMYQNSFIMKTGDNDFIIHF